MQAQKPAELTALPLHTFVCR